MIAPNSVHFRTLPHRSGMLALVSRLAKNGPTGCWLTPLATRPPKMPNSTAKTSNIPVTSISARNRGTTRFFTGSTPRTCKASSSSRILRAPRSAVIAVPATPATTIAVTNGANSRIDASTKKPPRRSLAPNRGRKFEACRPSAAYPNAIVETISGNQHRRSANRNCWTNSPPYGYGGLRAETIVLPVRIIMSPTSSSRPFPGANARSATPLTTSLLSPTCPTKVARLLTARCCLKREPARLLAQTGQQHDVHAFAALEVAGPHDALLLEAERFRERPRGGVVGRRRDLDPFQIQARERPFHEQGHRRLPGALAAGGGYEPVADLATAVAEVDRMQHHVAEERLAAVVGDGEAEELAAGPQPRLPRDEATHPDLRRVLVGADQDAEPGVLAERLGERSGVAGAQAAQVDAVAAEAFGDGDARHAAEPTRRRRQIDAPPRRFWPGDTFALSCAVSASSRCSLPWAVAAARARTPTSRPAISRSRSSTRRSRACSTSRRPCCCGCACATPIPASCRWP